MIAAIRLAVPYTGMILTAREPVEIRNQAINFGISQIDAGSSIGIGAYAESNDETERKRSQFELSVGRSLDTVIGELCEHGFIPSFCTGCYRLGRTGEHFMEFAIPGFVQKFCTPNAILTLTEYAEDYASAETKRKCMAAIEREMQAMPESDFKNYLRRKLRKTQSGKRDLYF